MSACWGLPQNIGPRSTTQRTISTAQLYSYNFFTTLHYWFPWPETDDNSRVIPHEAAQKEMDGAW